MTPRIIMTHSTCSRPAFDPLSFTFPFNSWAPVGHITRNSSWGMINMFLLRPLPFPSSLSCPGASGTLTLSLECQNIIQHHSVALCCHKAAVRDWVCQFDGCHWGDLIEQWIEGWVLLLFSVGRDINLSISWRKRINRDQEIKVLMTGWTIDGSVSS